MNTWINIHISSVTWISQMKFLIKGLEFLVDLHRNIILIPMKLNVHFVPQLKVPV